MSLISDDFNMDHKRATVCEGNIKDKWILICIPLCIFVYSSVLLCAFFKFYLISDVMAL